MWTEEKQRMFSRWSSMMRRCYMPSDKSYAGYGGREITVSREWHDFEQFWLDNNARLVDGAQLDRIDNDGPYSLENTRALNSQQNSWNRRSTVWVRHEGRELPVAEVARLYGINSPSAHKRVRKFGPDTANWPPIKNKVRVQYQGREWTLKEIAAHAGISLPAAERRYYSGWTPDRMFRPPPGAPGYHNRDFRN